MGTVLVIGIGSDIGRELAVRFAADGWAVRGTYRKGATPVGLPAGAKVTTCDLASSRSLNAALEWARKHCSGWDLVVVAAGTEEPIGRFWDCDAEEWERSVQVNALGPLRMVRALHQIRNSSAAPAVAFFSGAGTNSAAPAYSAYCASKILLIKMCELLDAESADTAFFIVGPGIVRTKIHQQTLAAGERGGANYRKVLDFLGSSDPGTDHDDIYACIHWCMSQGKRIVGGRNISLVHDAWKDGGTELARWLESDGSRYKLRRHGNDDRISPTRT